MFYGRTGNVENVYTLPPLLYPDGNWYLKLGANTLHDQVVDEGDIDSWYRAGNSEVAADDLRDAFHRIFPSLEVEGFHVERCVITYTPHGRPYVDEVESGLFVAAAGNGHGASWADGAGKLVTALLDGAGWDYSHPTDDTWNGFPRESFAVAYASDQPNWGQPLLLRDRL